MADAIERLRGFVEKAKRTGDYATLDKALDRSLPALLAVAEAAKAVTDKACAENGKCPPCCDCWCCQIQTALDNLETHG